MTFSQDLHVLFGLQKYYKVITVMLNTVYTIKSTKFNYVLPSPRLTCFSLSSLVDVAGTPQLISSVSGHMVSVWCI